MDMRFEREGLGYAMTVPAFAAELRVPSLQRRGGEWLGEIDIACGAPGIRSGDGHLHRARFNFSSSSARGTLARDLAARAQLPGLDWRELLEVFCRRVLTGQSEGEPLVTVGNRPARIASRFALDPVLPAGKATIFYGEGGTGKSTLAVAVGVSVQTGFEVIPGWRPIPGTVLYLDWETDADDLDDKVRAIAAGAGIGEEVELLYRPMAGPFSDQLEEIARYVTEHGVTLLVVDSLGLASGLSEGGDAADSTFRLFSAFRLLHVTVLGIDHVSAATLAEPARPGRPYGSVYKSNLARATFEIRRSEGETTSSTMGVYATKFNLGPRPRPMAFRVEQDDGTIRYRPGEFEGELVQRLGNPARIADALKAGAMHYSKVAELTGIPANSVRAELSRGRRFQSLGNGVYGLASNAG